MIKKTVATKYTVTFSKVALDVARDLEEFANSRGVKPTINPRTPPIHEIPPVKKEIKVAKKIKPAAAKKIIAKKL
ncbi:MAG TPA: hypothetical protein PLB59_02290 [Bacteroidales bacterium]|nr:hypothetical protein [Bacteroidales bacterium]HNZ42168.1 hypothetical protein [Bacteroidales bacterium]HPB25067.1 hypothetical protein [Bacteroidales bacterium]HPI30656.1 hypothetical protein [Bacteroidales bacterium]HQN16077.1 hypothetical protein [Bacteroidales bacterium]